MANPHASPRATARIAARAAHVHAFRVKHTGHPVTDHTFTANTGIRTVASSCARCRERIRARYLPGETE